jgi:hypothetical protein
MKRKHLKRSEKDDHERRRKTRAFLFEPEEDRNAADADQERQEMSLVNFTTGL